MKVGDISWGGPNPNTHQILADFDWVFKYGPYHRLITKWCGQRAKVTVIFSPVHSLKQAVYGKLIHNVQWVT